MRFAVYSGGAYAVDSHYAPDFGFRDQKICASESAAILYAFNRWPALCIQPGKQVGRVNRVVIWIFLDAGRTVPCAALVCLDEPLYKPNWELWRPYFEGDAARG